MSQKILIIQTAFIGDVLLSIPLLKLLRQIHPEARITYLCRMGLGSTLSKLKLINQVVELDKTSFKNYSEIKWSLRNEKWDWIICPHQSLRSQFLCLQLKASRKTSYKTFFNGFIFNDRVERPMELPEAMRTLALLQNTNPNLKDIFNEYRKNIDLQSEYDVTMSEELMDQTGVKSMRHKNIIREFRKIPAPLTMEIDHFVKLRKNRSSHADLEASDKTLGVLKLARDRKTVVIAPASVWETKIWRSEYFKKVCEKLSASSFIVLVGGPGEKEFCEKLRAGSENIFNAAGFTDLWESAELMACSDHVLTNDSGAMHLASLSSARVLSVFGPTVIEQGYRPWNNNAQTVESTLYCRPCGAHGAKRCPLGHHACMKLVYPEKIISLIAESHEI